MPDELPYEIVDTTPRAPDGSCACEFDWLPWIVAGLAVLWGIHRRG